MRLSDFIFKKFTPIPSKQWKQKIQYELKGANYQTELVKTNTDGISTLPYYTHSENKEFIDYNHAETSKKCIHINVSSTTEANSEALNAIKKGVDSIYFILYDKEIDTSELLKSIVVPVVINCHFLNVAVAEKIHHDYTGASLKILINPIGKLLKTGNWYRNAVWDIEQLQQVINVNNEALSINLSLLHNAGATYVQQLTYAIGQVIDYSKLLSLKNCKNITYLVSVSTDLYIEIAKLKALRILHNSLCNYLNISAKCFIILEKSSRNLHAVDTHLNSVITETEQLIGFAGNANLVTNLPEDSFLFLEDKNEYQNSFEKFINTDFTAQVLLFKDNLYIEKLVQQLVSKSIGLIENIEQGGGFLVQFKKGIIQNKIEEKALVEQRKFNATFTSIFNEELEVQFVKKQPVSYPFFKFKEKKTQYRAIVEKRLSAPLEKPIWDRIFKHD